MLCEKLYTAVGRHEGGFAARQCYAGAVKKCAVGAYSLRLESVHASTGYCIADGMFGCGGISRAIKIVCGRPHYYICFIGAPHAQCGVCAGTYGFAAISSQTGR